MATFNLHNTERALSSMGNLLVHKLKKELQDQGHVATGALRDSIKHKVESKGNRRHLLLSSLDYGKKLNKKRGRGLVLDARVLQDWLGVKGFKGNLVKRAQAAYNIREAIRKEGSPTKGSKYFSLAKGRRRIGWITETRNENIDKITKVINQAIAKDFGIQLPRLKK